MISPVTWLRAHPNTAFWITSGSIPLAYISVLQSLCHLRVQHPPYNRLKPGQTQPGWRLKLSIQFGGFVVAGLVMGFACTAPIEHPLAITVTRTASFFYACKMLDLAVAKAANPPTMMIERVRPRTPECVDKNSDRKTPDDRSKSTDRDQPKPDTSIERLPYPPPTDSTDYILHSYHYACLLLTQMRYHSFDITARQPHRASPTTQKQTKHKLRHYLPLLVIPPLTYLLPTAETKSLLLLLVIQCGLEGMHTALHPSCPNPVFWQPFAATSLTEFWNTHWQACASSWLRSLAYDPTQRLLTPLLGKNAARGIAVVNVFNLTGIWHAWAAAPAVEEEWAGTLALRVWLWFVSLGVGCVIENTLFGRKPGGWLRWIAVWAYALVGAGMCWRTLEHHDTTGYLRMCGEYVYPQLRR